MKFYSVVIVILAFFVQVSFGCNNSGKNQKKYALDFSEQKILKITRSNMSKIKSCQRTIKFINS